MGIKNLSGDLDEGCIGLGSSEGTKVVKRVKVTHNDIPKLHIYVNGYLARKQRYV